MRSVILVLALVALAACGDQVQKAKPPPKPEAEAPQMPPGHPTIGQGGGGAHGGADPFAEAGAASRPAMSAPAPANPGSVAFAGELSIDPAVRLEATYTIFISAVFGKEERAPVYIKRIDTPKFPFHFEILESDGGMGKRPEKSEKPLFLRAMISDTGDAMKTRNRTVSDVAYPVGTKDIKLVIKP